MELSFVVVTYNCSLYIERFLTELLSSLSPFHNFEILINDNDSKDNTFELCDTFASVDSNNIRLFRSDNVGFAKANNKLIKEAIYDNILLLNPDVFGFKNEFWEEVFTFWDRVNPLFVRLYNEDGTIQSTVGDEISVTRAVKSVFSLYTDPSFNQQNRLIEVQSGIMAFVFLSRKSLDDVGTISESYNMYGEDHDWFIRARKKGYNPSYYTKSCLIHIGGASAKTRWKKSEELKIKEKAQILLIRKNFKGWQKLSLLLILKIRRMLNLLL